jgi:hypothetical protein
MFHLPPWGWARTPRNVADQSGGRATSMVTLCHLGFSFPVLNGSAAARPPRRSTKKGAVRRTGARSFRQKRASRSGDGLWHCPSPTRPAVAAYARTAPECQRALWPPSAGAFVEGACAAVKRRVRTYVSPAPADAPALPEPPTAILDADGAGSADSRSSASIARSGGGRRAYGRVRTR